jgi:hypothetical protein
MPRPGNRTRAKQARRLARDERRAWVRYASDQETFCQPRTVRGEDELWWQGRVHNLSAGGIGLILSRRFEPGTVLTIEVQDSPARSALQLLGRVIHATVRPGAGWLVGCEFAQELDDDELRSLREAVNPDTADPWQ